MSPQPERRRIWKEPEPPMAQDRSRLGPSARYRPFGDLRPGRRRVARPPDSSSVQCHEQAPPCLVSAHPCFAACGAPNNPFRSFATMGYVFRLSCARLSSKVLCCALLPCQERRKMSNRLKIFRHEIFIVEQDSEFLLHKPNYVQNPK